MSKTTAPIRYIKSQWPLSANHVRYLQHPLHTRNMPHRQFSNSRFWQAPPSKGLYTNVIGLLNLPFDTLLTIPSSPFRFSHNKTIRKTEPTVNGNAIQDGRALRKEHGGLLAKLMLGPGKDIVARGQHSRQRKHPVSQNMRGEFNHFEHTTGLDIRGISTSEWTLVARLFAMTQLYQSINSFAKHGTLEWPEVVLYDLQDADVNGQAVYPLPISQGEFNPTDFECERTIIKPPMDCQMLGYRTAIGPFMTGRFTLNELYIDRKKADAKFQEIWNETLKAHTDFILNECYEDGALPMVKIPHHRIPYFVEMMVSLYAAYNKSVGLDDTPALKFAPELKQASQAEAFDIDNLAEHFKTRFETKPVAGKTVKCC